MILFFTFTANFAKKMKITNKSINIILLLIFVWLLSGFLGLGGFIPGNIKGRVKSAAPEDAQKYSEDKSSLAIDNPFDRSGVKSE